jgi:hypothetical protein
MGVGVSSFRPQIVCQTFWSYLSWCLETSTRQLWVWWGWHLTEFNPYGYTGGRALHFNKLLMGQQAAASIYQCANLRTLRQILAFSYSFSSVAAKGMIWWPLLQQSWQYQKRDLSGRYISRWIIAHSFPQIGGRIDEWIALLIKSPPTKSFFRTYFPNATQQRDIWSSIDCDMEQALSHSTMAYASSLDNDMFR